MCQEDELCCPTGCGSMCMKAVKPSPICSAVVNSTRNVSIIMIIIIIIMYNCAHMYLFTYKIMLLAVKIMFS